MFDLYIANKNYSSWSLRPWVIMKVLEIPFVEHLMPFEGGFGALRDECSMNCGMRVALNSLSAKFNADVARLDALWQQGLERFGGPFLAGKHFTAVDAFYAPVAFRAQTFNLPLSGASQAYVERLLALPAMQAWYQAALEESWREPMHEAETLKNGTLKVDYRQS